MNLAGTELPLMTNQEMVERMTSSGDELVTITNTNTITNTRTIITNTITTIIKTIFIPIINTTGMNLSIYDNCKGRWAA